MAERRRGHNAPAVCPKKRSSPVIEARGLDLTFQTADGPVQALRT
jgi:hypothetical protein